MALQVTEKNFDAEILQSDIPVLLDFWAEWCPPCKAIGPIIEKLASQYDGKVKIGKVNVDEDGGLAQQFNVTSIPTLIVLNKGKVVKQQVGAIPEPSIVDMFKPLI